MLRKIGVRWAALRPTRVAMCISDRTFDVSQLHLTLPNYSACKLICTIGPSTSSDDVLLEMMRNGMDVCRLNFSHGSHEEHRHRIQTIRRCAAQAGVGDTMGIALDTKGPEIRTAPTATPRKYCRGQVLRVVPNPAAAQTAATSYPADELRILYDKLLSSAFVGQRILIADGMVELIVKDVDLQTGLRCEVLSNDLSLSGRNNVHLPGVFVELPALSDQDVADITFGVREGVDMIFASFARSGDHIRELRKLLLAQGAGHIPIVAKIENEEGVTNIDDIIAASDGVMVARGDLGVEIPVSDVFLVQKMMTAKANIAAKPVICATQMLESMTANSRPTRAEASDVANAVIDGVDSVMLSGETANGRYPLESLKTLRSIAIRANHHSIRLQKFNEILNVRSERMTATTDFNECIAGSAILAAYELSAAVVVTTTISGNSVRRLAKYRPKCPIIAVCKSKATARGLSLSRGVFPITLDKNPDDWVSSFSDLVDQGVAVARKRGLLPAAGPLLAIVTNTDTKGDNDPFRCSMSIRWM